MRTPAEPREPGAFLSLLILTRAAEPTRGFLLVEGTDDVKFWSRFVEAPPSTVHACGSRLEVEQRLAYIEQKAFAGVVGFIDADHDHLERRPSPSPNRLHTGPWRDLESWLVATCLHDILHEHGDPGRIERFQQAEGRTVMEAVVIRAEPFGRLRWWFYRTGLGIQGGPRVVRYLDEDWRLDVERLVNDAHAALPPDGRPAVEVLSAQLTALECESLGHLCHGKDLAHVLALGLRRVLGENTPMNLGEERIRSSLRLAMNPTALRASEPGLRLVAWEAANAPYKVLKAA